LTGDRLITCKKNGGNVSELLRLKENRVRQEIYKEHLKEAETSSNAANSNSAENPGLAVTAPKRSGYPDASFRVKRAVIEFWIRVWSPQITRGERNHNRVN
jgi:hypothetical protein